MTCGGYVLGRTIPNPDKYLLPVIALIIVISVLPTALHLFAEYRKGKKKDETKDKK